MFSSKFKSTAKPTYVINASAGLVNEGDTVTFTVTTTLVPNGTTLYYTNSGLTTAADFTDGLNSGSFVINNNTGSFSKTLVNDITVEGTEWIIIQVRTGSISGPIVKTSSTIYVNDSSIAIPSSLKVRANESVGSTTLYDTSEYGNIGTAYNNGTSVVAGGVSGNCIAFPIPSAGARNSNVKFPGNSGYQLNNNNFTVECYLLTPANTTDIVKSAAGYRTIFGCGLSQNNGYCARFINLDANGGSTQSVQFAYNGAGIAGSAFAYAIPMGSWFHYCIMRSGNLMYFYINGGLLKSYTVTTNMTTYGDFYLGNHGGLNECLGGYMDAFRFCNGTLLYPVEGFTPTAASQI